MKRKLLVNVVVYGGTWVVVAGLSQWTNHLLNLHQDTEDMLWSVMGAIALGVAGDRFGGWLKSRQQ